MNDRGRAIVRPFAIRSILAGLAIFALSVVGQSCSDSRNTIILFPGSLVIQFQGSIRDGRYHGKGRLYHPNGKIKYHGGFKEGLFHGKGMLYTDAGILSYEGHFLNGKPDGHGRTVYGNGKTHYIGEWREGARDGDGRLFYEDGTLAYEGEFKNDQRHGYGRFYVYGRLVYEDRFENGKMVEKEGHRRPLKESK